MKKIDLAKRIIQQHSCLFRCPLCDEAMHISEPYSLICRNKHCYDLARQGYINLLAAAAKPSKYDKSLFASRLVTCQSGFFDPLLAVIGSIMADEIKAKAKPATPIAILDAGCGEGSHLANLVAALRPQAPETIGVGLDIAKEGVRIAAREYPGLIWCVGDLTRSPLQSAQFAFILNVLSPANYAEFARLLHDDGILIKVFPAANYLQELRQALYQGTDKEEYDNDQSNQLGEPFALCANRRLQYQRDLQPGSLQHLMRMTPLTWGASPAKKKQVLQTGISRVTVDVSILVGRKKS